MQNKLYMMLEGSNSGKDLSVSVKLNGQAFVTLKLDFFCKRSLVIRDKIIILNHFPIMQTLEC